MKNLRSQECRGARFASARPVASKGMGVGAEIIQKHRVARSASPRPIASKDTGVGAKLIYKHREVHFALLASSYQNSMYRVSAKKIQKRRGARFAVALLPQKVWGWCRNNLRAPRHSSHLSLSSHLKRYRGWRQNNSKAPRGLFHNSLPPLPQKLKHRWSLFVASRPTPIKSIKDNTPKQSY